MTQAATMTEQVAEAMIADACFQLADGKGEIDTSGGPAFVSLGGHRSFELDFERLARTVITTLQGSAALPSEAIADAEECLRLSEHGPPHIKYSTIKALLNFAMRAATPTAPVQDDDAEFVRQLDGQFTLETRQRLERIASRLSPTPDTGLIEALEFYADPENWHGVYMTGHGPMLDDWGDSWPDPAYPDGKPGEKARAVLTALANAAPAQVESGK